MNSETPEDATRGEMYIGKISKRSRSKGYKKRYIIPLVERTQKSIFQLQKLNFSKTTKFANKDTHFRHQFHKDCEEGLNKQINMELHASYAYQSVAVSLSRPDIGFPGYAKFFQEASDEERSHAEMQASFINSRGGEVIFASIPAPTMGLVRDPAAALELSINMEIAVLESLQKLHECATKHGDCYLTNFLEEHFISEGYECISQLVEMLTKLRRAGPGVGTELMDLDLMRNGWKGSKYKKD